MPSRPLIFHQDSLVTLYHGDSTKILPALIEGMKIAIVTDPPYGIDHASSQTGALKGRGIKGDKDLVLREWARELAYAAYDAPCILFGSWKREPPPTTRATLVWDKGLGCGMGDLSLPWKPNWEEIYVCGDGFKGHRGGSVLSGHVMVSWVSKGREHPNQKPLTLMEDLMRKIPDDYLIVDPFAGSAATLVAAKRMGRRAIGCELDPQWLAGAQIGLMQETLASQTVEYETEALL